MVAQVLDDASGRPFEFNEYSKTIAELAFELGQKHFRQFADEVLKHANGPFLAEIIDAVSSKPGGVKNADVRRMLRRRLSHLRKSAEGGKPRFSWRQEKTATFQGSKSLVVNHFLASNERQCTIRGFESVSHANEWISNFPTGNKYFVDATKGGRDSCCVVLTKTGELYKKSLEEYERNRLELLKWQTRFGAKKSAATRFSGQKKRQASTVTPADTEGKVLLKKQRATCSPRSSRA